MSYLLGALSSLLLSGVYQLGAETRGPLAAVLFSVILAPIALAVYWLVFLRKTPMAAPTPIAPRKGLIVIVSSGRPEESAALASIKYHYRGEHDERDEPTLQYLWLLHSRRYPKESSPPFRSSFQIAEDLERTYTPLLKYVRRLEVQDADDPAETFQRAEDAFWWATYRLRLQPGELVADITGGTKAMTAGLAYAGIPSARDIQFLKPRELTDDGRAVAAAGSDPLLIDVNFVERSPMLVNRR